MHLSEYLIAFDLKGADRNQEVIEQEYPEIPRGDEHAIPPNIFNRGENEGENSGSRYVPFAEVARHLASFWLLFLIPIMLIFRMHTASAADSQVARIVATEGKVTRYHHASAKFEGPAPRALFQGTFVTVSRARALDSIERGDWLLAGPGGRAKLVYENGDQLLVGPGTAYRIDWETSSRPQVDLEVLYGRVRALVAKGGPRSRFRVRAGNAVIGVRGTDFSVSEMGGADPRFEITVIRGKVEIGQVPPSTRGSSAKSQTGLVPSGAPVEVDAGRTAKIRIAKRAMVPDASLGETQPMALPTAPPEPGPTAKETATLPSVEVVLTSREQLGALRRVFAPPRAPKREPEAVKLEKHADQAMLDELARESPELAAALSASGDADSDPADLLVKAKAKSAPTRPADIDSEALRLDEAEDGAFRKARE